MGLHSIYRRVPTPPEVEINDELAQGLHQEVAVRIRAVVSDLRVCYHQYACDTSVWCVGLTIDA